MVYARKLVASVLYSTPWVPTEGCGWTRSPHGPGWISENLGGVTLQKSDGMSCTFSHLSDRPRLATLNQVAAQQLPPGAQRIREEIVPAVLRLPMRPMDGAIAPTAMGARRCEPVFPTSGDEGCVIDGRPVGLKVSMTWDGARPVSYFAEAAIGWEHVTSDRRPRSLLYPGDARRVASFATDGALAEFVSKALVALVDFADRRRDVGLEVDPLRRYQLPVVAKVTIVPSVDDIAFDGRLPTANGMLEFAAFPWPNWYSLPPAPGAPSLVSPPPTAC